MNFTLKNLVPVAAFASVASVSISSPAHALFISPPDTISFSGDVIVTDLGSGNYGLDFQDIAVGNPLNSLQDTDGLLSGGGVQASVDSSNNTSNPPFQYFDFITVADLPSGTGSVPSAPWLADIDLTDGSKASFNLNNIFFEATTSSLTASLFGDFLNAGGSVIGSGGFALTNLNVGEITRYTADLKAVPTPAAVLPILTGLFGAASKRKRDEEENA